MTSVFNNLFQALTLGLAEVTGSVKEKKKWLTYLVIFHRVKLIMLE